MSRINISGSLESTTVPAEVKIPDSATITVETNITEAQYLNPYAAGSGMLQRRKVEER